MAQVFAECFHLVCVSHKIAPSSTPLPGLLGVTASAEQNVGISFKGYITCDTEASVKLLIAAMAHIANVAEEHLNVGERGLNLAFRWK